MKNKLKIHDKSSNSQLIKVTKSDKYIEFYIEITKLVEEFCYFKASDLLLLSLGRREKFMSESEYSKAFNIIDFGLWNDFKAEIQLVFDKYKILRLVDSMKMEELRSGDYAKHISISNLGDVVYASNIQMKDFRFQYKAFYYCGDDIQGNSIEYLVMLKLKNLFDTFRFLELKGFYDLSELLSSGVRINDAKVLQLLNKSLGYDETNKQIINFLYHLQIDDYQDDLITTWGYAVLQDYNGDNLRKKSIVDMTTIVTKFLENLRKMIIR